MSAESRRVIVLDNPGGAWPCAQDLAAEPDGHLAVVELEGRQIEGAQLIACFRWLFGE